MKPLLILACFVMALPAAGARTILEQKLEGLSLFDGAQHREDELARAGVTHLGREPAFARVSYVAVGPESDLASQLIVQVYQPSTEVDWAAYWPGVIAFANASERDRWSPQLLLFAGQYIVGWGRELLWWSEDGSFVRVTYGGRGELFGPSSTWGAQWAPENPALAILAAPDVLEALLSLLEAVPSAVSADQWLPQRFQEDYDEAWRRHIDWLVTQLGEQDWDTRERALSMLHRLLSQGQRLGVEIDYPGLDRAPLPEELRNHPGGFAGHVESWRRWWTASRKLIELEWPPAGTGSGSRSSILPAPFALLRAIGDEVRATPDSEEKIDSRRHRSFVIDLGKHKSGATVAHRIRIEGGTPPYRFRLAETRLPGVKGPLSLTSNGELTWDTPQELRPAGRLRRAVWCTDAIGNALHIGVTLQVGE